MRERVPVMQKKFVADFGGLGTILTIMLRSLAISANAEEEKLRKDFETRLNKIEDYSKNPTYLEIEQIIKRIEQQEESAKNTVATKNKDLKTRIDQRNQKVNDYNKLLDEFNEELKNLDALHRSTQAQVDSLISNQATAISKFDTLSNTLIERHNEVINLVKQHNLLIEEIETETHPLVTERFELIEDAKQQLSDIDDQIQDSMDEFNTDVEALKQWLGNEGVFLDQLESDINDLVDDLNRLADYLNIEGANLNALIDRINNTYDEDLQSALIEDFEERKRDFEGKQDEYERLKGNKASLESEYRDAEANVLAEKNRREEELSDSKTTTDLHIGELQQEQQEIADQTERKLEEIDRELKNLVESSANQINSLLGGIEADFGTKYDQFLQIVVSLGETSTWRDALSPVSKLLLGASDLDYPKLREALTLLYSIVGFETQIQSAVSTYRSAEQRLTALDEQIKALAIVISEEDKNISNLEDEREKYITQANKEIDELADQVEDKWKDLSNALQESGKNAYANLQLQQEVLKAQFELLAHILQGQDHGQFLSSYKNILSQAEANGLQTVPDIFSSILDSAPTGSVITPAIKSYEFQEILSTEKLEGNTKEDFLNQWFGLIAKKNVFQAVISAMAGSLNGSTDDVNTFIRALFINGFLESDIALNRVDLGNGDTGYQIIVESETLWLDANGQLRIPSWESLLFQFPIKTPEDNEIGKSIRAVLSEIRTRWGERFFELSAEAQDALILSIACLRSADELYQESISIAATQPSISPSHAITPYIASSNWQQSRRSSFVNVLSDARYPNTLVRFSLSAVPEGGLARRNATYYSSLRSDRQIEKQHMILVAQEGIQFALGFTPAGDFIDLYEFVFGKSIWGRELTNTERLLAGFGLIIGSRLLWQYLGKHVVDLVKSIQGRLTRILKRIYRTPDDIFESATQIRNWVLTHWDKKQLYHVILGEFSKDTLNSRYLIQGGMHTQKAFDRFLDLNQHTYKNSFKIREVVDFTEIPDANFVRRQNLANKVVRLQLPRKAFNQQGYKSFPTKQGTIRGGKTLFPSNWSAIDITEATKTTIANGKVIKDLPNKIFGEYRGVVIEVSLDPISKKPLSSYPRWDQELPQ